MQPVPVIDIILSPFLWAPFMARVDASQAEADRLDADARPPEPVSVRLVALLVAGVIIGRSALLIFVFLAAWQFLNPGVAVADLPCPCAIRIEARTSSRT